MYREEFHTGITFTVLMAIMIGMACALMVKGITEGTLDLSAVQQLVGMTTGIIS